MITKVFEAKDMQVDIEKREVIACISSDAVDRDGEIVLPSGLQKEQYNGNPVVLWGHDNQSLPIGKTMWIKTDGKKVIAKYKVSDKTQIARDVFALMQDGVLSGHSVGFLDLEASPPNEKEISENPTWKDATRIIRKWQILEFSVVNVPCNPEALAIAVSKSCTPETAKFFGVTPKEDCVLWEDEEEKATIPQPVFCRSWKSIEKKIFEITTPEEIIARLKGKV